MRSILWALKCSNLNQIVKHFKLLTKPASQYYPIFCESEPLSNPSHEAQLFITATLILSLPLVILFFLLLLMANFLT